MASDHVAFALVSPDSSLYLIMRGFGRLAFPLFAFMIAEGFLHTSNFPKYFRRMLAFAFISELPFDIFIFGRALEYLTLTEFLELYAGYQNVFFTFVLALAGLYFFERLRRAGHTYLGALPAAACAVLAELMQSDYGWVGVAMVFIFYVLHDRRVLRGFAFSALVLASSALDFLASFGWTLPNFAEIGWNSYYFWPLLEIMSLFSFAIIALFYSDKRGRRLGRAKYLFYAFYPAHLAVIGAIALFAN